MASQPYILTLSYVGSLLQDASITQATKGATENVGEFNPFSASDMVSPSFFVNINTDVRYSCSITEGSFSCLKSSIVSIVSQGNHSDTTIPISAASSQPAILQTSVEQSAQVSQTRTFIVKGN